MQLRGRSSTVALFRLSLVATFITLVSGQLTIEEIARRYTVLTPGGIHVPIVPWERSNVDRHMKRAPVSTVGIGDVYDVIYSALVTIGGTTTPLLVDTGSSDLWVLSDTCTQGCGTAKLYPQGTLRSANMSLVLRYGDSRTGTFASGVVGFDTIGLGTVAITNQPFSAINRTNTTLPRTGVAGILGIGFPSNSVITSGLFRRQIANTTLEPQNSNNRHLPFDFLAGSYDSRRQTFPSNSEILGIPSTESRHVTRQSVSPSLVQDLFTVWNTRGPFVPRLIAERALPEPQVTVTLQRNMIEIGGNLGMLSIGELPTGVKNSDLTWVALRNYDAGSGGIPAPLDSPSEVYPLTWEVMIDNIYFDGERLPLSISTPQAIGTSALVDTGNSLLRGPEDIVSVIQQRLGPSGRFRCAEPHNLTFEIGGKLFPVDPRDFARQAFDESAEVCISTLVATDPPRVGGYLFSWSLGVPFLKGVLSSYYFGNITYPSQDPPKMGFLSTVPRDAAARMRAAAAVADRAGSFPAVVQMAPSVVPSPVATDSHGVPQAKATNTNNSPNHSPGPTLGSGEPCHRLCSPLSYLSPTAFLSLIIAGWNIGL